VQRKPKDSDLSLRCGFALAGLPVFGGPPMVVGAAAAAAA